MVTITLYARQQKSHRDIENFFMVTKGEGRCGVNWEIKTDTYTLLYKNLLFSTGNSTQYPNTIQE